ANARPRPCDAPVISQVRSIDDSIRKHIGSSTQSHRERLYRIDSLTASAVPPWDERRARTLATPDRNRPGLQIYDEKDIRSGPRLVKERERVVQLHACATERETSVHRWSPVR